MINRSLIKDTRLTAIAEKVLASEAVTEGDAEIMLTTGDITGLGVIAGHIRHSLHGEDTFYSVNYNCNYTNICELRCPLCAFSRDSCDGDAYILSLENIKDRVREGVDRGIDEVHIVGGLHPDLKLDYFTDMLKSIKSIKEDIFIVAFTAVEIDYFAAVNDLPVEDVLQKLIDAGLGAMPGGGAEIFAPEKRNIVAPKKISGERWLSVAENAHKLGLRTNVTMLYNQVEDIPDIINHLSRIRDLQDKTGGFKAFVPLPFHQEKAEIKSVENFNTGFDDVRIFAASRIFLHNVPHVKALWMYLGEGLAQVLLDFGVDDIGGTYSYEKVVHEAGARTPNSGSQERLEYLIRCAGKNPVRAAADYRPRK